MKIRTKPEEKIWADFQEQENLTNEQLCKFKDFANFLLQKNAEFNLTAIKDLAGVVRQHFQDSLAIRKFSNFSDMKTICDIGTGAGFPAIPLKIVFPHLKIVLIEVTKKKVQYLMDLIKLLELENIEIQSLDWRTFLRKFDTKIDLFVTRAAIDEVELIRAFKPACLHKDSQIAYWTTQEWECHAKARPFIKKIDEYKLGSKHRKIVFLGL